MVLPADRTIRSTSILFLTDVIGWLIDCLLY